MSRHGDIVAEWDGEEVTFRLAIGHWRKIQERCDAGPAELLTRLAPLAEAMRKRLAPSSIMALGLLGTWRIDDVREPILQGLLGGGKTLVEAEKLIRERVDERPWMESVLLAYSIVGASVFPVADEQMGEGKANRKKSRSRMGSSGSPGSTATAQR